MPATSVMTRGMYVSSGKSSGGPIGFHSTGGRSNSAEPAANPSAGRAKADTAIAPAPWAVAVMKRRRVTVSPSKAPGMPRSAVYLLLGSLRPSAMGGRRTISTHARARVTVDAAVRRQTVAARSAFAASRAPARAAGRAAASRGGPERLRGVPGARPGGGPCSGQPRRPGAPSRRPGRPPTRRAVQRPAAAARSAFAASRAPAHAAGRSAASRGGPERLRGVPGARPGGGLGGLELRSAAVLDGGGTGGPRRVGAKRVPLGVGLGRQRYDVGQLRNRSEVAQLGE